jgi:plastocyanin
MSSLSTSSTVSTSAGPSGELLMEFASPSLLASPDLSSLNYSVSFHSLGNVPASVLLNVVTPIGLTASLSPANLTFASTTSATLQISASQSIAPGNYQIALTAFGQGETFTQNESIQVVKYLVVTIAATYVPQNLTVTQGSTVSWFRLNGVLSQYDNGDHNVAFSSGTSAVSPDLAQYATWTYTFAQVGTYSYYCKYHPFMTGEITVT